jgi:hypothetical protein
VRYEVPTPLCNKYNIYSEWTGLGVGPALCRMLHPNFGEFPF